MGLRLVVAILAVMVMGPRVANANAAARAFDTPEAASGAFPAARSAIEVAHEDLTIRCDEVERRPRCRFSATYHLNNPTAESAEVTGAFYGSREAEVTIRLDGADARVALAPRERIALDDAVRQAAGVRWDRLLRRPEPGHLPESQIPPFERAPERTGFRVRLAAGTMGRLVFDGPLDPIYADNPNAYGGLAIPAYQTRHAVLASLDQHDAHYDYLYLLAPLWTWAGARTVSVEISAPSGWRFDPPALPGQRWSVGKADGRTVARATLLGDPSGAPALRLAFVVRRPLVLHGGPVVAVGGAFGDAHGLRLRVGYEFARPDWMVYSLALETNARDRFAGALVAEATTPCLAFIIPSLGLGLGPVVERAPGQVATGARVQATLSWLLISAVLHADVFPGQAAPVRWALLGQVSF